MDNSVDSSLLRKRLAELQQALREGYAAFGASCAATERLSPLGACHEKWEAYDACLAELSNQERDFQRLKYHFEAASDAFARIKAMQALLRQLDEEKERLAERLGAASYEAYLCGQESELVVFLSPVFHDYAEASRSRGGFLRDGLKLLGRKRGAYKLFRKAGRLLLAQGNYHLVPNPGLVEEVDELYARQAEASQNLASDMESVKGCPDMTDKSRLERMEKHVKELGDTLQKLAYEYGVGVFEEVPPPVIQQKVGGKAYQQGLDILALQNAISQVSQIINREEGERRAKELDAQIELRRQQVQLLQEQKRELDGQISRLYGEMSVLRHKAFKLRGSHE